MFATGFHGILRFSRQRTRQKIKVCAEDIYANGYKQKEGLREDTFIGYRRASYG